jgi:hypothetical protein
MTEHFEVREIEHRIAKPFIVEWHYSRKCPTGRNIFFGAFIPRSDLGPGGDGLYAVAGYGPGINADGGASLAKLTGRPVTRENYVELTRLCRKGAKHEARIAM